MKAGHDAAGNTVGDERLVILVEEDPFVQVPGGIAVFIDEYDAVRAVSLCGQDIFNDLAEELYLLKRC